MKFQKFYFIIFLFLFLNLTLHSQIFVSPSGDDTNPGTIELPFKTLTKAVSVSGPDTLIYMRGGVYYDSTTVRLNKTGQANKYIKIWAYPGEKPILDFSSQPISSSSRGIQISHNYWHVKGLEIRNAKDNGIYISAWYTIVENCVIHNCNDTGLQISGNGSYNLILNCDSYGNNDPLTNGENADGFAPKLDIGPGNIFRGCRAWNNADDGWDIYEGDEQVLIEDCWAFRNGFNIWGIPNFQGDGNGFKLGGNFVAGPHKIIRSVAFDNKSKGFDQNNNTARITLHNNTGWRNQSRNFSFPSNPTSGQHELKNNISYSGNNQIAANSILETNSWVGFTVTDADFISLDTLLALVERDSLGNLPYTDFLRLASGSSLIDAGVPVGLPYNDSAPDLGAFETDGIPSSVYEEINKINFHLEQNFPNPFNPVTKIKFVVGDAYYASPTRVLLRVYNILGKEIATLINEDKYAGSYEIEFDALNFAGGVSAKGGYASGVYFYSLSSDEFRMTKKMTLLK